MKINAQRRAAAYLVPLLRIISIFEDLENVKGPTKVTEGVLKFVNQLYKVGVHGGMTAMVDDGEKVKVEQQDFLRASRRYGFILCACLIQMCIK